MFNGPWTLDFTKLYRLGLVPPGTINELDTLFFTPLGDIYDSLVGVAGNPVASAVVSATAPGLDSCIGSLGDITFAAVQPLPVPAAAGLFGSGLIRLIGIARRRIA